MARRVLAHLKMDVTMTRHSTLLTLTISLAAVVQPVLQPAQAQLLLPDDGSWVISDIRVDGLQRISAGTVFNYLPLEKGDRMDKAKSAEAIRALFKTGFFQDVKLERQGNILVITVAERPAINKITLVGNKDIKTPELMKGLSEIGLAEGETFDKLSLDRVTQELTRQYNNRGKYNVRIDPAINTLDRNRVDITITVAEGKPAKLRHINIVGNETYTDDQITDVWESHTHNWLSWYKKDDQYSREKLSGDLEKLSSYYLDRGYVDFNLDSTQVSISPDRRDMFVTANVTEGEVYKFGKIKITGDTIVPMDQVERLVLAREGYTFSRRILELSSDGIITVLANVGYAFANVTPIPTINKEDRTVDINLFVEPGQRVTVRRILFNGNQQTADEVIRREMRQFEGAWYSQAAIDRSKVRLQRLGYFEDVKADTRKVPGSDDLVDVVYSVTERNSGSFIFGVGYSQLSGVITSVSLVQNNFFGTGSRVGVTVQNNAYVKRLDFSYYDPYFTDDGLSVGYNIVYRELDQRQANIAAYTSNNGAFQTVFGIPLTENDTLAATIGIDKNQINVIPGLTPDPIVDYIQNKVGRRTFHAWRTELAYSRDTRNAFFNPTRGTYHRVSAEVALPGSTQEYYKLSYQFAKYWPLSRSLVLLTSADLGYGDGYGNASENGLPFFENFYAGGVRSVRGFEDNTLGPTFTSELNPTYHQPLGGALKTTGTLEMLFPTLIKSNAAQLSAFVDFGNVFADTASFSVDEFRASAGISLKWQAPVGPIVINFSQPLRKQDDDRVERLQFSFGTQF